MFSGLPPKADIQLHAPSPSVAESWHDLSGGAFVISRRSPELDPVEARRGLFARRTRTMGWDRAFSEPILLPKGKKLANLRDAALFITKLPKVEHDAGMAGCNGGAAVGRRTCRTDDVRPDRRDAGTPPAWAESASCPAPDGFAVSDVDWESKVACETVVRSDRRAQACAAFFLNLAPHAVHAFRFRSLGLRMSFVLEDSIEGPP